ncbi:hypothetical protein [Schaalia sp. JY-X169]|uniref:hypothetical protein n=1 Tax=Schaalia sp. JY-X169 TaxID=2758572 RepID=UPI0015F3DD5F|nr:hypothetical protein [Schaalia sp. JY-X169]
MTHEVLSRNPMDHVSRLRRPVLTRSALAPEEANAIHAAIAYAAETMSVAVVAAPLTISMDTG